MVLTERGNWLFEGELANFNSQTCRLDSQNNISGLTVIHICEASNSG